VGYPASRGRARAGARARLLNFGIRLITAVDCAKLDALYKFIDGVNVDSPEPEQVHQARADLLAAITDARSGQRDLSDRFESQCAQKTGAHPRGTPAPRSALRLEWFESTPPALIAAERPARTPHHLAV
jgi:hypothetical protein